MEFKVRAVTYRAGTMDAFTQLHVARRFGCVLGIVAEIQRVVKGDKGLDELLGPLGNALADMPDDKVNYILNACLDATEVKQDGGLGWAKFRANGLLMYPLDLQTLIQIASHVIRANLAGFMQGLPPEFSVAGLTGLNGSA